MNYTGTTDYTTARRVLRTLADDVRAARALTDLSLRQAAAAIGVDPMTLQRFEHGGALKTGTTLKVLAWLDQVYAQDAEA